MAVVSLASAYTTYIATERGDQAGALDSIASQQSAEEQQAEQQFDAKVAEDQRLLARYAAYDQTQRRTRRDAAAVRTSDPGQASWLDLQEQADSDLQRALNPFFRTVGSSVNTNTGAATYDDELAKAVMRMWDWRLFRADSATTRELAATTRARATSIVLVVVVLVLALFLLTLAHVAATNAGLALAVLGTLAATVAIVRFFLVDAAAAAPLALAIGLVALIAIILVRLSRDRRWFSGGEMSATLPGLIDVPATVRTPLPPVDAEEVGSRLPQLVAVVIAAATLLAAGVGYLHGEAALRSDGQAWIARELGVRAIGALRSAEENTAVGVGKFELALTQRVAGWNAAQQQAYAKSIGDATRAAQLQRDADGWLALADSTEQGSGIAGELGQGSVCDQAALERIRAGVSQESARLAALQDAANAASRHWSEHAAAYVSVLAWLTVAAYLLGLAVVFRERAVRALLSTVGVVMVAASVVWIGSVWAQPWPASSDVADRSASTFAQGVVALVRGENATAEARFTEVIAARPDFVMRGRIEHKRSSPQVRLGRRVS